MNLGMEDVLNRLYEVELQSYLEDFPTEMDPESRSNYEEILVDNYEEILVDSLTNIKNFMSSFGVTIQDFFNQDKREMSFSEKSGKKGKGKAKGASKGEIVEEPGGKGEKSQSKTGSKNKPKEPMPPGKPEEQAPLGKSEGATPSSKPMEPAVIAKTKPQQKHENRHLRQYLRRLSHQNRLQSLLPCQLNQR